MFRRKLPETLLALKCRRPVIERISHGDQLPQLRAPMASQNGPPAAPLGQGEREREQKGKKTDTQARRNHQTKALCKDNGGYEQG